jgi:hypothetical protein
MRTILLAIAALLMGTISDNVLRPTNTWQGFHCASEIQDWIHRQRIDDDVLHFVDRYYGQHGSSAHLLTK